MNAIIGYASLLMEGIYGTLNDKQQRALVKIDSNAQLLLKLLNDILDLSKIEAGKMPMSIEDSHPASIINTVIVSVGPLIRSKQVELVIDVPEDIPNIKTDVTRLEQVLMNLLSNAAKFTHQGKICVSARKIDDEHIEFSVEDTGIGIKKGDMEYIFEEFRQVDGSSTREYGGAGLGLSIAKKMIETMQGRVGVESHYGKGSRFWFVIPIEFKKDEQQDKIEPEEQIVVKEQTDLFVSTKKILIVGEDDVFKGICNFLKDCNFELIKANIPIDVFHKSRLALPHVIVIDMHMPGEVVEHILRDLRGHPETNDIPILGLCSPRGVEMSAELGVLDLLVSPFDRQQIKDKINSLIIRKEKAGKFDNKDVARSNESREIT